MTDNELVATPTETQNEVEEPATPEVAEPAATDGAETPAEPAKTADQLEIERLKKELAHKARALTKRDRTQGKLYQEREQIAAELADLKQRQPAQQNDEPAKAPTLSREEFEREAKAYAAQLAAQDKFNAQCNSIAEEGKKAHADFADALNALIEEAGPLVQHDGKATPLGDLIVKAKDAAGLIVYLGKNPEIAAELDGLSTGELAWKLADIKNSMTAKPHVSSAPKPLNPVKGPASNNELSDDLSIEEWTRRRNKQLGRKS